MEIEGVKMTQSCQVTGSCSRLERGHRKRMEGEFPKMVWPPKVRLEATDDNNARQSSELAFKWDDNYLTCQMHH